MLDGVQVGTVVDLASGSKPSGFNDVYMINLEDHSTGKTYPNMSNGERVTERPVVAGNAVYVVSSQGNIEALDLETGEQRWHRDDDRSLREPVLAGEELLVGAGWSLLALDASTGRALWSVKAEDRHLRVAEADREIEGLGQRVDGRR